MTEETAETPPEAPPEDGLQSTQPSQNSGPGNFVFDPSQNVSESEPGRSSTANPPGFLDKEGPESIAFSWKSKPVTKLNHRELPERLLRPTHEISPEILAETHHQKNFSPKGRRQAEEAPIVNPKPEPQTFITQISSKPSKTPPSEVPKSTPVDQTKRKVAAAILLRRKSQTAPQPKPFNLNRFDDPDFDAEAFSSEIPPRLLAIITHPPASIVFRAICGVPLENYSEKVLSNVIFEVQMYQKKTIQMGLIGESQYLSNIIDSIKKWKSDKNIKKDQTTEVLEDKRSDLLRAQQESSLQWEEKKTDLEIEKEEAITELQNKYDKEVAEFDEMWNSEQVRAKYNKPSAKLIEMREEAKINLKALKFDMAARIAEQIKTQEEAEVKDAAIRMRNDYDSADARLKAKFDNEMKVLEETFANRMSSLEVQMEKNLRPVKMQIEVISHQISDSKAKDRRKSGLSAAKTETRKNSFNGFPPPIKIDAKLSLPPLKQARRDG